MGLVIDCFTKNGVNFRGRASRKEYWLFQLASFLIFFVAALVDKVFFNSGVIGGIFMLLTIIPNLSVSARRLHDTNRSAWFLLLCFIPIIGTLCLFIIFCIKGNKDPNRYGGGPRLLEPLAN